MQKLINILKGGATSGNFGHAGRPGELGGSAPKLTLAYGNAADVQHFQLFNEYNQGDDILLAKDADNKVVAYAQVTDNNIYFLESEQKGSGRWLVDQLKAKNDYLIAHSVEPTAR